MKTKIFFVILSFLIIIISSIFYLYTTYDRNIESYKNKFSVYYLFDFNDCTLKTNLETKDIEIFWSCGENRTYKYCIYKNNRFYHRIKNEYGTYIFDVYYKNVLIAKLLSQNLQAWETYTFNFSIYKNGNVIQASLIDENPRCKSERDSTVYVLEGEL